jgi:hypothetical protein
MFQDQAARSCCEMSERRSSALRQVETRVLDSLSPTTALGMSAQASEPSVQTLVSVLQPLVRLHKLSLTLVREQTTLLVNGLFRELITDVAIEEHRLAWRRRSRINAYVAFYPPAERCRAQKLDLRAAPGLSSRALPPTAC